MSLHCWGTAHRRIVVTDVSGQPIRPIFKGHAVQEVSQEHLKTQLYGKWCGQWLVLRERDAK